MEVAKWCPAIACFGKPEKRASSGMLDVLSVTRIVAGAALPTAAATFATLIAAFPL